jgi:hypothetical protein
MTHTEQVIKKAEGTGYSAPIRYVGKSESDDDHVSATFLDPLFWQSLGKALGWGQPIDKREHEWGKRICLHCGVDTAYQPPKESGCNHAHYPEACSVCSRNATTWRQHWHRFIDHLAEGKTAEEFFKGLT